MSKQLQKDTRRQVQELADQYGLEAIPANVEACLLAIPKDPSPAYLATAALRKMEMACLAAMARGEVAGPDSPESLERRARQAEGLAKMLVKKEDPKAAARQLKRAESFRKQAAALTAPKKELT